MAQDEEVRQVKAYKYSHKSGTNMTTTVEQDYDSPAAQHILTAGERLPCYVMLLWVSQCYFY